MYGRINGEPLRLLVMHPYRKVEMAEKEGVFNLVLPSGKFVRKIVQRLMKFMQKKGWVTQYLHPEPKYGYANYSEVVVNPMEVMDFLSKYINKFLLAHGGRSPSDIECIVVGVEVFSKLNQVPSGVDCFHFPVEGYIRESKVPMGAGGLGRTEYHETRFGIKIKVVRWFDSVLIIPKDR